MFGLLVILVFFSIRVGITICPPPWSMVTGICCVGLLFLEGDFDVVSGFEVVGDACFFHGCVVDERVELAWFEGALGFSF